MQFSFEKRATNVPLWYDHWLHIFLITSDAYFLISTIKSDFFFLIVFSQLLAFFGFKKYTHDFKGQNFMHKITK